MITGITSAMTTYSHRGEKGSPGGAALWEMFASHEKKFMVPPFGTWYCDYLANLGHPQEYAALFQ